MTYFSGIIGVVKFAAQDIDGMPQSCERNKPPRQSKIETGSDQQDNKRQPPGNIYGS
jgi:hypothetical protein